MDAAPGEDVGSWWSRCVLDGDAALVADGPLLGAPGTEGSAGVTGVGAAEPGDPVGPVTPDTGTTSVRVAVAGMTRIQPG